MVASDATMPLRRGGTLPSEVWVDQKFVQLALPSVFLKIRKWNIFPQQFFQNKHKS